MKKQHTEISEQNKLKSFHQSLHIFPKDNVEPDNQVISRVQQSPGTAPSSSPAMSPVQSLYRILKQKIQQQWSCDVAHLIAAQNTPFHGAISFSSSFQGLFNNFKEALSKCFRLLPLLAETRQKRIIIPSQISPEIIQILWRGKNFTAPLTQVEDQWWAGLFGENLQKQKYILRISTYVTNSFQLSQTTIIKPTDFSFNGLEADINMN